MFVGGTEVPPSMFAGDTEVTPNYPRVTVPYVASDANLADSLTKILPTAPRFEWAVSRLRSWVMAA